MDNAPAEAPSPAPAEPSVETPTSNEPAQTQSPTPQPIDLGLTPEQAEKFKKFISNSGGFDNAFSKLKTDISTPKSVQPAEPQPSEPVPQPQPKEEPVYQTPKGAITQDELMAKYYFESLSKREQYAPIAKEIAEGTVLTEMAKLGIPFRNQDGSWNDEKINDYLDLRAKTVPAKPTEVEPNASPAPTVDYVAVGDKIDSLDQAYKVIMQPGHPMMKAAEEFIKNSYSKK